MVVGRGSPCLAEASAKADDPAVESRQEEWAGKGLPRPTREQAGASAKRPLGGRARVSDPAVASGKGKVAERPQPFSRRKRSRSQEAGLVDFNVKIQKRRPPPRQNILDQSGLSNLPGTEDQADFSAEKDLLQK